MNTLPLVSSLHSKQQCHMLTDFLLELDVDLTLQLLNKLTPSTAESCTALYL